MYSSKCRFDYALKYAMIFPKGMENRKVGKGSVVITDEYIIYFKENTPEDIKTRFIKEYAEYYANMTIEEIVR